MQIRGIFKKKEDKLLTTDKPKFFVDLRPKIPVLPDFDDKTQVNVRYPLIPPYAYAHIYYDKLNKQMVYEVEEPVLNDEEKNILDFLEKGIRELINISFIGANKEDTVLAYLEKNIDVLLSELDIAVKKESYLKIMYFIYRDFIGLNEIEPFLSDYFVEDIECNGVDTPLYIVHRKYRNLRTNVIFKSIEELNDLVEKLAQKAGKYISYATPLLDGNLPDGSRVNATYATDVSSRGPTFTIRKFTKEPWTPIKLIDLKTVSPEILAYLWLLIEYESNIMVIGGTSTGKTTMLNALAFFIPPQSRIVSIEDTRELSLRHENWLPSVARQGVGTTTITGRTYGEVTLFDLLKESFRQNPDYVIVGEVRGQEAFVLFQGAASGHPSFSTMHANSVDTMVRRLETHPINLSASLVNIIDVVCVMAQTRSKGQQIRRLKEVVEIVDVKEGIGNIKTNTPLFWDPKTDKFYFRTDSHVLNKIQLHYGITRERLEREFRIRTKLLIQMYRKRIFGFREVQDIINAYYKDPLRVLKRFNLV